MAGPKKYDIFISYSHKDEPWASEFADALKAEGVEAWFDKENIAAGDLWSEKLEQALRESSVIIALVSPDYASDPSTNFELGAAVGGNKKIIPVLTHGADQAAFPSLLRHRRWLHAASPKLAGKRVAEAVGLLPQDKLAGAE